MKILIAHDGSEGAQKALDLAIDLAKRFRAKLHMIMVKEPLRFPTRLDDVANAEEEASHRFEQLIADAVAQATKRRVLIEPRKTRKPNSKPHASVTSSLGSELVASHHSSRRLDPIRA